MADIEIKFDTSALRRFGNSIERVNPDAVIARALNHTGAKVKTAMIKSLTAQTGLKRKVIVKALKVSRATYGSEQHGSAARQSYTITSRGGDISLKFFSPKETRGGVIAAPWGKKTLYAGTFMKGGKFPKRVELALGGHVMKRVGGGRLPISIEKSDLYIPEEMVKGATAAAFQKVASEELEKRLAHEIEFALGMPGL